MEVNQTGPRFARVIGLTRDRRLLFIFLVVGTALILAAVAPKIWAQNGDDEEEEEEEEVILFEEAEIRIEVNATDGDAGLQLFADGEAWERIRVADPDGQRIFNVRNQGNLGDLGSTELFTESEEPPFDELPLEEFLTLFPAGVYEFTGRTVDKINLTGVATLTHNIPAMPTIVSPEEDAALDPDMPVVIEWEPVTEPLPDTDPQATIEIVRYQVIVEREEPEPLLVFSIDLPASATSVTVPPEFIEPEAAYKFEVLAVEISGNQTIAESVFETE